MAEKTYWWVSVGGNPCEPAVVVEEKDARLAYTFGCPDPFRLDDEDCPVLLVDAMTNIPLTPAEQLKRDKAWALYRRRHGIHGYRRF